MTGTCLKGRTEPAEKEWLMILVITGIKSRDLNKMAVEQDSATRFLRQVSDVCDMMLNYWHAICEWCTSKAEKTETDWWGFLWWCWIFGEKNMQNVSGSCTGEMVLGYDGVGTQNASDSCAGRILWDKDDEIFCWKNNGWHNLRLLFLQNKRNTECPVNLNYCKWSLTRTVQEERERRLS